MYYGRGYGRSYGMGTARGKGFGFRGSSPPWPHVGIGRGGLPRCRAYGGYGQPAPGSLPGSTPYPRGPWAFGPASYGAPYSPQDEVRILKDQAEMIGKELEAIEARLKELEKDRSSGGET
jgi:hypothetical protein